jgi:hypothetical protein
MWPTPDVRGFTNEGSLKMLAKMADSEEEFMGMAYRAAMGKKKRLWPTPKANSGNSAGIHGEGGLDLQTAVKLFPTPVASDWKHHGPLSNQRGLADIVRKFPTPTANDARNSLTESQRGRGTLTARLVETESEITGQLNPEWVEWLMGYPVGWTDLKDSAIALSLKFPN